MMQHNERSGRLLLGFGKAHRGSIYVVDGRMRAFKCRNVTSKRYLRVSSEKEEAVLLVLCSVIRSVDAQLVLHQAKQ